MPTDPHPPAAARGEPTGYVVRVLGPIDVVAATSTRRRPLSGAKQQLLAALVAGGPDGVAGDTLAQSLGAGDRPMSGPALRMAVARLRDHLPDGALPDSVNGRYRLELRPEQVDAWHLLRVAAAPDVAALTPQQLRHLLRPSAPFDGAHPSLTIDEAASRVRNAQRDVLASVAERSPHLVDGELIDSLRAHRDDDPHNERLLLITVLRLASTGDRRGALNLISEARAEFARIGLSVSEETLALEQQLLDGRFATGVADRAGASVGAGTLPPRLRDQLDDEFVGSRAMIEHVRELVEARERTVVAVVEGITGAGKTRTLAEVARDATAAGWSVLYVPGTEGAVEGSFGPFLACLPAFHDEAAAILRLETDAASRRSALWCAARDAIVAESRHGPTLLLVDDAQWLDSQSQEFVAHLAATNARDDLAIVVAGRSDIASRESWAALRAAALRSGAAAIELGLLNTVDLRDLVRSRDPGQSAWSAWRVAGELQTRCGGLPGVAIVLLASLDGDARFPDSRDLVVPVDGLAPIDAALSEQARTLGLVAAVLGGEFDVSLAVDVSGLSGDAVLDGLDDLVRHGLVVEHRLTRFASRHALVDAAFLQPASRSEIVRLHRRAAHALRDDVHRFARHAVAALPVMEPDTVAAALLASARQHLDDHLFHEAALAYRDAVDLLGGRLEPPDAIGYSRALDLSGSHEAADAVRGVAFDQAMRDGRTDVALRCAISGLPEAEPIDGAPSVVRRLRLLGADDLSPGDRWLHAHHTARQSAIMGDIAGGIAWAERSGRHAVGDEQAVASALVRRFAMSATSPPSERLEVLDSIAGTVDGFVDPALAGEYWLVRAIDLYELGDTSAALDAHAHLRHVDALPVTRQWHADLFEAMVISDTRGPGHALQLRARAFDVATRAGLREAENAFLIASFTDVFADGTAGALLSGVESGAFDPQANTLMRAGVATILAAAGDIEGALDHAERVARSVVASPISQGLPALAVVAHVIAHSTDHALRASARAMLAGRGPSLLVLGAGATCLGPAERYVAQLTDDPKLKRDLLVQAALLAERSGLDRWITVLDHDLAQQS